MNFKQLWSGPHIKREPEEFADKSMPEEFVDKRMLRDRHGLYEEDQNDFVEMDEWLHAVPNPLTIEDTAFGRRGRQIVTCVI